MVVDEVVVVVVVVEACECTDWAAADAALCWIPGMGGSGSLWPSVDTGLAVRGEAIPWHSGRVGGGSGGFGVLVEGTSSGEL